MNPSISIIIPTRNRARTLEHCLSRICRQTLASEAYEIIVIDDASEDETQDVLKRITFPNISALRLDIHGAAGAARNLGLRRAKGEIVLLLDDDAFVASDFVQQHLASHQSKIGITTGPIVVTAVIPEHRAEAYELWRGWHRNPFPSGNVSLPRAAIEKAGMFDEAFSEYGWEDPELFQRLKWIGLPSRFSRAVPIYHYKPVVEAVDFPELIRREQERGRMATIYYAKHPTVPIAIATKRLPGIIWADHMMNRFFDLDENLAAALAGKLYPRRRLWRQILMAHAEIVAGNEHSSHNQ